MPPPEPITNPFEVIYCPRCHRSLPSGQAECPHCEANAGEPALSPTPPPAPGPLAPEPLDPQPVRRWHPLDIVLLAAMLAFVALDIPFELSFGLSLNLVESLATAAAYGLVAVDIWQDGNGFGAYAYIATGWRLFWLMIGVIMGRAEVHNWVHVQGWVLLALIAVILPGLWRRYGPPFEQKLY